MKHIIKGNNPNTLVAFNFAIIGLALYGLFTLQFNPLLLLITGLVYFLMICFGISITYHRSLTHRAVKLHPYLEKLGCLVASLAGTGSPIMWVLTHRMHHRHSDKEDDPHPPSKVWKTFLGNYPRVDTYGIKDVASSKFNRILHKYYFGIVLSYGLIIGLLFGVDAFFYIFVYTTFFNILISNSLNWFGHKQSTVSYRNFNLKDTSSNNPIMALLAFGEGWHNNHHRYPGSASFGVKKYEIDVSYAVIMLLSKLGLASAIRTHRK
jgi:stearoyl-CoA desaturase (delta-9 desaturase)